jgi:hypothetical protein
MFQSQEFHLISDGLAESRKILIPMTGDQTEERNEALEGIATVTFRPFDVVLDLLFDGMFWRLATFKERANPAAQSNQG